jgi:carboxyl-terminal processing protease
VVVSTKSRDGQVARHLSQKRLLNAGAQIVLLADKKTFCGAELFVAALRENRPVKIVGEPTFGKWNVQGIEPLPNRFAVKYTIQEFQSPRGNSFMGTGIKPDIEVSLDKDADLAELRAKTSMARRLSSDAQLKAALELIKAI